MPASKFISPPVPGPGMAAGLFDDPDERSPATRKGSAAGRLVASRLRQGAESPIPIPPPSPICPGRGWGSHPRLGFARVTVPIPWASPDLPGGQNRGDHPHPHPRFARDGDQAVVPLSAALAAEALQRIFNLNLPFEVPSRLQAPGQWRPHVERSLGGPGLVPFRVDCAASHVGVALASGLPWVTTSSR
jgi:hypothetical protein